MDNGPHSLSAAPDGGMFRGQGVVTRLEFNSLGYLYCKDLDEVVPFRSWDIEDYDGESFEKLAIRRGAELEFVYDRLTGTATRLSRISRPLDDSGGPIAHRDAAETPGKRDKPLASEAQQELLPTDLPLDDIHFESMPRETRKFGKYIDTRELQAGDLILSRMATPSGISSWIASGQEDGGYSEIDARWTHAAMYLGDGLNVVEADLVNWYSGKVKVTSLCHYCKGVDALRFRRHGHIKNEREGWLVCLRALMRLGSEYDIQEVVRLYLEAVWGKRGFYDSTLQQSVSKATTCSSLYSSAFVEAIGRRLSEVGGTCVPAWLSATREFRDLTVRWRQIVA